MTDKAYEVPLHEQLANVPRNARLVIDDADGMGTRFIPVGRMCHEAAEALRARLAQPEPYPENFIDALRFDAAQSEPTIDGWPLYSGLPKPDETMIKRVMDKMPDMPIKVQDDWALGVGHLAINPEIVGYVQPKREWVGLTDEEIQAVHYELKVQMQGAIGTIGMYRMLEKALREKNT